MKTTVSIILFTLLLVFACGDKKKNTQEELHDKVMALHDEIMPKMGDIMKFKKQLNNKIDALIEEGSDANAEKITELRNVVEDLENSHEGMMNWMREFDNDFEGMVNEEVIKYLNEQVEKIEKVGESTNNALKKAEEVLAN